MAMDANDISVQGSHHRSQYFGGIALDWRTVSARCIPAALVLGFISLSNALPYRDGGGNATRQWSPETCSPKLQVDDLKSGKVKLRGVGLGGWLVAERWITPASPIYDGVPWDGKVVGEYQLMKRLGHERGDTAFAEHRRAFITEADFAEMAALGLNGVRVPIGFWITEDKSGGGDPAAHETFAPGAVEYLDLAMEWGCRHGLAVMVSMHAPKGSQNGFENSAPAVEFVAYWSHYPENVQNTLDVVRFIVERYGQGGYPSFLGISLINEPTAGTTEAVLRDYFVRAYDIIRNDIGSDCIIVHAPLFEHQDDDWFGSFLAPPDYYNTWHEWHKYQVWHMDWYTAHMLVDYAREILTRQIQGWTGVPLLLGEWSLAHGAHPVYNTSEYREYALAQAAAFRHAGAGWLFWTWKHWGSATAGGGWSLQNCVAEGWFPLEILGDDSHMLPPTQTA